MAGLPSPALHPFVFRYGRVGDMIIVTPLLRLLHARYGGRCYVVGCGSWNHDVLLGSPDVERNWAFTPHVPFAFTSFWLEIVAALRRTAPGPIYITEWDPKTLGSIHRLLAISGIDRRRVIHIGSDPTGDPELHWSEWITRFGTQTPPALSAQDYPPPPGDWRRPSVTILPRERAACAAWIAERGWSGRPIILVQPGNHRSASRKRQRWRRLNKDDKAWPVERWGQLIRRVHARLPQAQFFLRGAPTEVPMLEEIRAASGLPAAVTAAYMPLRATFVLCTLAHSMISVDTGPAHAAAALGLPMVVLFGLHSPSFWSPQSTGSPVLKLGGPPFATRVDQIPMETVFDAWCQLLEMPRTAVA